jgi:hypothetical protein
MTDYKAAAKHWAEVEDWSKAEPSNSWDNCILELRSRIEVLEDAAHKHIVETSANILALASRVDALEAAKRPASKVYEINEPLTLKEQSLALIDLIQGNEKAWDTRDLDVIRRALEALPSD